MDISSAFQIMAKKLMESFCIFENATNDAFFRERGFNQTLSKKFRRGGDSISIICEYSFELKSDCLRLSYLWEILQRLKCQKSKTHSRSFRITIYHYQAK